MKVAFTSKTGDIIDTHFGQAQAFQVWEVGPEEAHYVETLKVSESGLDEEDRITARARTVSECAIVYTMQIGGPAAAKLVAQKIHPMKTNDEVPVSEVVAKLQEVLKRNPPPWLRKAMNKEKIGAFFDEE